MLNYLLQRLATIIPTLFFVSVLIFGLQQLLPGDPAIALAGEDRDPNVVAYLRAKFHLDEPLPVRYGYWLKGVLHGDLGGEEGHMVGLRRQRVRALGPFHAELLARHPAHPAFRRAARLAARLRLRESVRGPEGQSRGDDHAGVR